MLIEWLVKEKYLKYLTVIPREVDQEDNQTPDGGPYKYQRDALNIIYSSTILLYMFRVSSTHLQEDTVVCEQHMVPSLCKG